jgi:hypothetical protein
MRVYHQLVLACALAISACAPFVSGGPAAPAATAPPTTFDTIEITGTQGLIVAELAYNSAATAVKTSVEVGLIKPGTPLAATLRDLNRKASIALETARGARTKVERAAAIGDALAAIASLGTSTPKPGAK